jgi:hypothetical protein
MEPDVQPQSGRLSFENNFERVLSAVHQLWLIRRQGERVCAVIPV